MLEPLEVLIKHSPLTNLKAHLLQMTKTFKQLKDGYPDLMVLKEDKLTFEEVKAPGDKLSRNQNSHYGQQIHCLLIVSVVYRQSLQSVAHHVP
ncbi:MAG: VRR-NUC domain-containing protein [Pseudomonadota bacterium]